MPVVFKFIPITRSVLRFSCILLALLLFVLTSSVLRQPSSVARAQDEQELPLLPGAKHEYRFDYKGDRTQIDIVVEGHEGLALDVYVPGQVEPVGQGARDAGGLHWSGKFNAPGAYRATVENKSPGPIVYSIAFLGESVSNVGQIVPEPVPPSAGVSSAGGRITLNVNLPTGPRRLQSPVVPVNCTPAGALPPEINSSVKLCPNEIYPPLHLVGNGIGLFSDEGRTAVINSAGRQFAVVMEGTGNWMEGVVIQSAPDAADAGAFLCQYDECVFPTKPDPTTITGGLAYGGGALVLGRNNVIHNVTARGGTIGIATVDGYNNTLVENNLSDLNGWGSFNIRSNNSVFAGNRFDRDNHGCATPDGRTFEHGCETAGFVCLQCAQNLIANNHCEYSGNCYYLSGERGLASNNNRFIGNYCAGSPNNCFEFTFSRGNTLQDNIATAHPQTGVACKYPFWIGGSTVYFGKNTWGCLNSAETSIEDAVRSTNVPTVALALGSNAPVFGTAVTTPPPTRAPSTSVAAATAPAPVPVLIPRTCNARYRVRVLFDWEKLGAWVECILTPALEGK